MFKKSLIFMLINNIYIMLKTAFMFISKENLKTIN